MKDEKRRYKIIIFKNDCDDFLDEMFDLEENKVKCNYYKPFITFNETTLLTNNIELSLYNDTIICINFDLYDDEGFRKALYSDALEDFMAELDDNDIKYVAVEI